MSVLAPWLLLVLVRAFLVAAVTHVKHPERLASVLSLVGISPRAAPAIAVLDAGIVFVLFLATPVGAGAALLYLLVVTVLLAKRGWGASDCACSAEPEKVDHRFVLRNAALVVAASVILLAETPAFATAEGLMASGMFVAYLGVIEGIRRLARRDMSDRRLPSGAEM